MLRSMLLGLIVLVATSAVANETVPTITVTGEGEVAVAPDVAELSIGVTNNAPSAEDALRETSDALRDVIALLQRAGVAQADMQTSGLSLRPNWITSLQGNDTQRQLAGYIAQNGLIVRIRDLDLLGRVLDDVVQGGANTLSGLQFSVQDPETGLAEARALAVRDARMKAQHYADAAGIGLGPVQSISENNSGPRPIMMDMNAARSAADVPIVHGEVIHSASIMMVFAIGN